MKKVSEKKVVAASVAAPIVPTVVVPAIVLPTRSNRRGSGLDISGDRVITEINSSKGNPYAVEAQRNGLNSKAGDKYRAWEMAKPGMSVSTWRQLCEKEGIALFLDSGGIKKTVMLGDPPPPPPSPEELALAKRATKEAAKALKAKTTKRK